MGSSPRRLAGKDGGIRELRTSPRRGAGQVPAKDPGHATSSTDMSPRHAGDSMAHAPSRISPKGNPPGPCTKPPETNAEEIIVRLDDFDASAGDLEVVSVKSEEAIQRPDSIPLKAIPASHESLQASMASSTSVMTDESDLSSLQSVVSSKATTPIDVDSARETGTPTARRYINTHPSVRREWNVRPRVSLPTDISPLEYAAQCLAAADSSLLHPYALHVEEYNVLREHISHAQVTTYLNIRNGILRLWMRNPQIAVTREEAIGCARDTRWFDVANVCFDWLVRGGYINFGCVEIRHSRSSVAKDSPKKDKRRRIVVIGAGMSGLGCARQLEGLFLQYRRRFKELGEEMPEVLVLEGRDRVGGRVYSRAFKTRPPYRPASSPFHEKRCTAEMGGMIITGFDRGNPLNILVRGQLCLPYHALRSETTIYDSDGKAVDLFRDQIVEKLYNDCLDRVSEYKFKSPPAKLIEGNREQMDEGRDSAAEGLKSIAIVEEIAASQPLAPPIAEQNLVEPVNLVPVSSDRITGKPHVEPGTPATSTAAHKARSIGWILKPGVDDNQDVDLETPTKREGATLGSVMDDVMTQYKDLLDLTAQDYRLLNWHVANLEYSNAINYHNLSLQGWDIDAGNEWEGKHTMIIGGYQDVPRGLMHCPMPLAVRKKAAVRRVTYTADQASGPAVIECEDGSTVTADMVVSTIPLGVLKHKNVEFNPPLPGWKQDAIDRLGFGVLNKVILVYSEPFWDESRDIFGVLQDSDHGPSLKQGDYTSRRGRFFQFLNVSNTSGLPVLIALMAGDAAFDTEKAGNDELVREATEILRNVFGSYVPEPLESVVTRWASDKFARGSYSSAGPHMKSDDYDTMARPIGNLYFAGEHTTGTHPATVHGAYLSGLRAASEVLEAIIGPIEVPTPLIVPKETPQSLKRKALEANKDPKQARLEAYELEIWEHIYGKIGYRPFMPVKPAMGAYFFYTKAHFEEARKKCEQGRRASKSKSRSSANEIRAVTAKMWKEASPEERKPYEEQAEKHREAYAASLKDYNEKAAGWDKQALELRAAYEEKHPSVPTPEELASEESRSRRSRMTGSYAEPDGSDVEMAL